MTGKTQTISLILLLAALQLGSVQPVAGSASTRVFIVELGRSQMPIWGLGLGTSILLGSIVVNVYYRPPAEDPPYYSEMITGTSIDSEGTLESTWDNGTGFFNVKWVFPVYKRLQGSVGVGMKSKRKLELYYVANYDYHYALLKSTQYGTGQAGLRFHVTQNFTVSYEYHTQLKSLFTLGFQWHLRRFSSR